MEFFTFLLTCVVVLETLWQKVISWISGEDKLRSIFEIFGYTIILPDPYDGVRTIEVSNCNPHSPNTQTDGRTAASLNAVENTGT